MSKIDFFSRLSRFFERTCRNRLSRFGRVGLILSVLLVGSVLQPYEVAAQTATFDLETKRWSSGDNASNKAEWIESRLLLLVGDNANIVVTGSVSDGRRVDVAANATARITLKNCTISIPATTAQSHRWGILLESNANLTLILENNNSITAGINRAGIGVHLGSTLTIDGTGTLAVTGKNGSAGIGGTLGNESGTVGNIIINGGTIWAFGGAATNGSAQIPGNGGGAGIGGGGGGVGAPTNYTGSSGGTITINGGAITATGGAGGRGHNGNGCGGGGAGAGIGGGGGIGGDRITWNNSGFSGGNSGIININGGLVTAIGGANGARGELWSLGGSRGGGSGGGQGAGIGGGGGGGNGGELGVAGNSNAASIGAGASGGGNAGSGGSANTINTNNGTVSPSVNGLAQIVYPYTATWNSSERRIEIMVPVGGTTGGSWGAFKLNVDGTDIVSGNFDRISTENGLQFVRQPLTTNSSKGNVVVFSRSTNYLNHNDEVRTFINGTSNTLLWTYMTIHYYPDNSHLGRNVAVSFSGTNPLQNITRNIDIYNPMGSISWSNLHVANHGQNYDYSVSFSEYPGGQLDMQVFKNDEYNKTLSSIPVIGHAPYWCSPIDRELLQEEHSFRLRYHSPATGRQLMMYEIFSDKAQLSPIFLPENPRIEHDCGKLIVRWNVREGTQGHAAEGENVRIEMSGAFPETIRAPYTDGMAIIEIPLNQISGGVAENKTFTANLYRFSGTAWGETAQHSMNTAHQRVTSANVNADDEDKRRLNINWIADDGYTCENWNYFVVVKQPMPGDDADVVFESNPIPVTGRSATVSLPADFMPCQFLEIDLELRNESDALIRTHRVSNRFVFFDGSLNFASVSISKGFFPDRVSLAWAVNPQGDIEFDRYEIYRSMFNSNSEATEVLVGVIDHRKGIFNYRFEDRDAIPGIYYNYRIDGQQECPGLGLTTTASDGCIGFIQPFGTVSGRITYEGSEPVGGVAVMAIGTTNTETTSARNKSLFFNGSTHISLPYREGMLSPAEFTFQSWIRLGESTGRQEFMSANGKYEIDYHPLNKQLSLTTQHIDKSFVFNDIELSRIRFQHITVTYARNGDVSLYIDGALKQTKKCVEINSIPFPTGSEFEHITLGKSNRTGNANPFTGFMDEVRLWNRVLSANEIKENFDAYISGRERGLRLYYRFDEDDAIARVFDISGANGVFNENHGNISGTIDRRYRDPDDIPTPGQLSLKAHTDSLGNYILNAIPYFADGNTYDIVPSLGVHRFDPNRRPLFFSAHSPVHNSVNFTDISSFKVSGLILYEGGTYPVADCTFEIDDRPVTLANGDLMRSNPDGSFTINVPIGVHKVRVVKDGHTFYNDGLIQERIVNPNTGAVTYRNYNYNDDMHVGTIINTTRVKLIGHIVGGIQEHEKVSGFGARVNNIGSDVLKLTAANELYELWTDDEPMETVFHHNSRDEWARWTYPDNRHRETKMRVKGNEITINVCPETGEFVAWLYPELYYIEDIQAGDYGNIYTRRETLDLRNAPVTDNRMLQIRVHSWTDEDEVQHSDTVRFHREWSFYHQAHPTFTIQQIVDDEIVDYFGDAEFVIDEETSIPLVTFVDEKPVYTFSFTDFANIERDVPVFRQGEAYAFLLSAFEIYANPAIELIDTVRVAGGIASIEGDLLPESDRAIIELDATGRGLFVFPVGTTDVSNGVRRLSASLRIGNSLPFPSVTIGEAGLSAFVLGGRSTGTDFLTAAGDEIDFILHDPPGSNSYAYIEAGTSLTFSNTSSISSVPSMSVETITGDKVKDYSFVSDMINKGISLAAEKAGQAGGTYLGNFAGMGDEGGEIGKIAGGFAGDFINNLSIVNTVSNEIGKALDKVGILSGTSVSSQSIETETIFFDNNTSSTKITFNDRYETSSDPAFVGHNADIFFGKATNTLYGLTNNVAIGRRTEFSDTPGETFFTATIDGVEYAIGKQTGIGFGESFDTYFAYTGYQIENIMIPKWSDALKQLFIFSEEEIPAIVEHPVYLSYITNTEDIRFGRRNDDPVFGSEATFDLDGPSYRVILPPDLQQRMAAGMDPDSPPMGTIVFTDSVVYYNEQIRLWESHLADNERRKANAITNNVYATSGKNISFGSGVRIERSESMESTVSSERVVSKDINMFNITEAEAKVNLLFTKVTVSKNTQITPMGSRSENFSEGEQFTDSHLVGFVLEASGTEDQLTVDYCFDYESFPPTFMFRTRGGRTSCPFEPEVRTKYFEPGQHVLMEGTMQIEVPELSVIGGQNRSSVPSTRPASFMLELKNQSETNGSGWFRLTVDESTNPHGAVLRIDGLPIGNGRYFMVPSGTGREIIKTLTVEKGPIEDDYEDIRLLLTSVCDSILWDDTYISVHFLPSCTEVAFRSPVDNWVINVDSDDHAIEIELDGYDVNYSNFGYIGLEYRRRSEAQFRSIMSFYADETRYDLAQGAKTLLESNEQTIKYTWYKDQNLDGEYEFRARSVCETVGVGGEVLAEYETTAVSGWVDTSRPVAIGAPSPSNGILGAGDELSITFNEDIQSGLLTHNNFTISGILNASEIAEPSVGIAFQANQQYAQTELPIFASGSFSIETWFKRDAGTAGTLFEFGGLSLGFNAAGNAVVKINGETYTSEKTVTEDGTWKFAAMNYDRDANTVAVFLFEGSSTENVWLSQFLTAEPQTQGRLTVGNNAALNDGFRGAVSGLHFYGVRRILADVARDMNLTKAGNENGLIGYWSMDEAEGDVARDKARSRHLALNTDWYIYPSGWAMRTSGNNYFSIPTTTYDLDAFKDVTLEFWFRSEHAGASANAGQVIFNANGCYIQVNENGGLDLYRKDADDFSTGIVDETLIQTLTNANLMDTRWHHVAISVRRGGSVNVYINGVNSAVFSESLLGAHGSFASEAYYFGVKRINDTFDSHFAGYFDEIRIWNSALSRESVILNKNSKLSGDEPGLQAYYPFENYTRPVNGPVTVTSTRNNMTDSNTTSGEATLVDTGVPVADVRSVEHIPHGTGYTFVASNNRIVFTLDERYFARVEGATLTITVDNVRDMRNNRSNTETWTAFVRRNPLRWDTDPVNLTMQQGDNVTFTARITNTGGTPVNYALENLPSWLTVSGGSGSLAPLANRDLTFTISQGVNVGDYETAIGLVSGNGVREILPAQLKVTGWRPDWNVNPNDFESSMNIIGRIKIDGVFKENSADMLGAFIGEQCVGVASPVFASDQNAYFVFSTIYGNAQHHNQLLTFRLWDASTGRVYPKLATSVGDIHFAPSRIIGNIAAPVIFDVLDEAVQLISLRRGWNWISANVLNDSPAIFDQMKSSLGNAGELVKGHDAFVQQPGWLGTLSSISETNMYLVNVNRDHSLTLSGKYADPATTPININEHWNWIGYLPAFTLSVSDALAGIEAQDGDQIKGQTDFAVWTGANWIGSLSFMEEGKGYMYYSNSALPRTLIYPSDVSLAVRTVQSGISRSSVVQRWSVANINRFSSNMTLTAVVVNAGAEMRSEQVEIAAFSGQECRGSAVLRFAPDLDRYIGFLMIYGDGNESITLRVYDHAADMEHTPDNTLTFAADVIHGNPSEPFRITFGGDVILSSTSETANIQATIYPNPVTDRLYIERSWETIDIVEIYDTGGRLILRQRDFSDEALDVSNIAPGMYILNLIKGGEVIVKSVVVSR